MNVGNKNDTSHLTHSPAQPPQTGREWDRDQEILQQVAQAISGVTGRKFFRELVVQLAQTLEMDRAFVGELTENGGSAPRCCCAGGIRRWD